MAKTNFIVTGANGFLGSYIIKQLLTEKHQVTAVILKHNDWSTDFSHPNLKFKIADIRNFEKLAQIFKQQPKNSIIIHAASIISIATRQTKLLKDVNIKGTENIIELAKQNQAKRLVYISSVHALTELPPGQTIVETNDFDPKKVFGGYSKTKAAASKLVVDARQDLDTVIIHPSGLIGPNDPNRSNFKQMIIDYAKGEFKISLSGGYDFSDVRDVAKAIVVASTKSIAQNQNYILSNQFLTLSQLLKIIDDNLNRKQKLINLPKWLALTTGFLAEIFYKLTKRIPVITYYSIKVLYSNGLFSHAKATQELDYQPRPIEQTIKDTVENLKQQKLI